MIHITATYTIFTDFNYHIYKALNIKVALNTKTTGYGYH